MDSLADWLAAGGEIVCVCCRRCVVGWMKCLRLVSIRTHRSCWSTSWTGWLRDWTRWVCGYPGVKLGKGGSHRISDPTPLVWDPLPLITDPVPHNWYPAPFCLDPPVCTVYIWVFSLCMMFCKKNVVLQNHFVICVCPCLVWIDVASVKHYLNVIKTK